MIPLQTGPAAQNEAPATLRCTTDIQPLEKGAQLVGGRPCLGLCPQTNQKVIKPMVAEVSQL
jgi:hypothetical protein